MGDDVGLPAGAINGLRLRRRPLVVVGQHFRSRKAEFFLHRLRFHRGLVRVLANSTRQRAMIIDHLHLPPEKVGLILDHVDTRFFQPDATGEVVGQVCSAGLADRDYGTLVEAVRDTGMRVKIEANSAWMAGGANVTVDQLHDGVEFTDLRTTIGLRGLYAESQIVAVTLREVGNAAGFNTILEGMATGKPVVTTSGEMQSDFIVDGVNGFLVPPGDVEALRDRLTQLRDDPSLGRRLGERGRADVEAHYSVDHYRTRIVAELTAVGLPPIRDVNAPSV